MLIFGKVMSGAPIWSGTTKFPKAANAIGTMPEKDHDRAVHRA